VIYECSGADQNNYFLGQAMLDIKNKKKTCQKIHSVCIINIAVKKNILLNPVVLRERGVNNFSP